jgi:secretion/DNA translocation related TadE-like protein
VTGGRRRDDAGFAAPAAVALTGLVLVAALVGAAMGRVLVDQRRAAAAADLAALAAATALQVGGSPCSAARRSASRNGAELSGCAVAEEQVRVELVVSTPALLGRVVRVAATAHAGPAESSASSSLTAPHLSSPRFYAALLEDENNDVLAASLGTELRYELDRRSGLAISGQAFYAPDILAFGSADNLTDLGARIEIRLQPRLTVYGGMRWFEFELTDGEGDRTLQEELFAGVGWRL